MRIKTLLFLLSVGFIAVACWLVRTPAPSQADEIPEPYRNTVAKGLDFLAKQQGKDGHWEGDTGKHPVAMTGLVGLALLMAADPPREKPAKGAEPTSKPKYADSVARAADWLMQQSKPGRDGLIFSEHASETGRYMEGHGLATLFLGGVCRYEQNDARRRKLAEVLSRAVKYIVKAQSSKGGWYHTSKVEGHDFDTISVTVIQIQALQAAENAGVSVPTEVIVSGKKYLIGAMAKYEAASKNKSSASHDRLTDTTAALCGCVGNTGAQVNVRVFKALDTWLEYCQAQLATKNEINLRRDALRHYYFAQTWKRSNSWPAYRKLLFDHLQNAQAKDGSWEASEGLGVGRTYATGLWCVVLQLDKGNHPATLADIPVLTSSRKDQALQLFVALKPVTKSSA